jgi:aerobic C4-dicarboxylate transport protein
MALLRQLYIQVLIAIALAVLLGIAAPATAIDMKPLGDGLIALLRMMLGPIIFCSVVLGLAHVGDMGRLGRLAAPDAEARTGRVRAGHRRLRAAARL